MSSVVTTLVEGSHFVGVAALFNSLVQSEFDGEFVIGYRGAIPGWFQKQIDTLSSDVSVTIRLLPVQFEGHMTNLKPHWMLSVFEACPNAMAVTYADPDVCLVAPWRVIDEWIGNGVAVAENCTLRLPQGHWRVRAWGRFVEAAGYPVTRESDVYVNGGFVGIAAAARTFLTRWQRLTDRLAEDLGGHHITALPGGTTSPTLNGNNRFNPFSATDQDVLNCTVRSGDEPLHLVGPDGMGFVPGLALMTHALGARKPWDRAFVREALGGRKPSYADKTFFSYCDGPLRPFSKATLARKRAALKLACAMRGRGWS